MFLSFSLSLSAPFSPSLAPFLPSTLSACKDLKKNNQDKQINYRISFGLEGISIHLSVRAVVKHVTEISLKMTFPIISVKVKPHFIHLMGYKE